MKKSWRVFSFIVKCTLIGFGGGNALLPVIKKEAVEKRRWLSSAEFHNLAIATNSIPGPSVVEMLSFIAMHQLGKVKGALVAMLAFLPHILLAFALFLVASFYLPKKYLLVIAASVMPVIAGILVVFGLKTLKESRQQMQSKWLWTLIFLVTLLFVLFIPAPYNIPVIVMVFVIIIAYLWSKMQGPKKELDARPNY